MKSRIHDSETAHRDYLITRFLFNYALRRSEATALTWKSIQPDRGIFQIIQKGNRILEKPLLPDDWQFLCEFRSQQQKSGRQHAECPYIFHAIRPNPRTKRFQPISTSYIFKMIVAASRQAVPEKNITPHSFRTTFVPSWTRPSTSGSTPTRSSTPLADKTST